MKALIGIVVVVVCISVALISPSTARADTKSDNEARMRANRIEMGYSSSEDHRYGKNANVTLGVGGLEFGYAGQVSVGYFIAPNLQLSIDVERFVAAQPGLDGVSAGSSLTWFIYNTFYVQGGLHWTHTLVRKGVFTALGEALGGGIGRGASEAIVGSSPDETSEPLATNDMELLTAHLGLGNRWQLEWFTIGCEWFGVDLPVAVLNNDLILSDWERDVVVGRMQDRGWERVKPSFHWLSLHAGVAF